MLNRNVLKWPALRKREYEIAIFQTEHPRDQKGYKKVYQGQMNGENHNDVISQVFRNFNIRDLIPKTYQGRTISSGDIVMIVDRYEKKSYYKLQSGGWAEVNRLHVC